MLNDVKCIKSLFLKKINIYIYELKLCIIYMNRIFFYSIEKRPRKIPLIHPGRIYGQRANLMDLCSLGLYTRGLYSG